MGNDEIWQPIPKYEGYYEASSLGNIRSCNRSVKHPKGGFLSKPSRAMRTSDNGTGYLKVMLSKHGRTKMQYAHRLIISAFLGESNLDINHINHNRSDNRISNLEYVTKRENQQRRKIKRDLPVGVYMHNKKYRAIISIQSKQIRLGVFDTPELAKQAYDNKLKETPHEYR